MENVSHRVFFSFSWLNWVFAAVCRLSLIVVSRGSSSLRCTDFSLWWHLLLWNTGSRVHAQQLWHVGLIALQSVGSSLTRDWTPVPCIGRRTYNHWITERVTLVHACSITPSRPILCNSMDCSLPDSSVNGIFQARLPEWVVISSSRGSSQSRNQTRTSCISCIERQILYLHATCCHVTLIQNSK